MGGWGQKSACGQRPLTRPLNACPSSTPRTTVQGARLVAVAVAAIGRAGAAGGAGVRIRAARIAENALAIAELVTIPASQQWGGIQWNAETTAHVDCTAMPQQLGKRGSSPPALRARRAVRAFLAVRTAVSTGAVALVIKPMAVDNLRGLGAVGKEKRMRSAASQPRTRPLTACPRCTPTSHNAGACLVAVAVVAIGRAGTARGAGVRVRAAGAVGDAKRIA